MTTSHPAAAGRRGLTDQAAKLLRRADKRRACGTAVSPSEAALVDTLCRDGLVWTRRSTSGRGERMSITKAGLEALADHNWSKIAGRTALAEAEQGAK